MAHLQTQGITKIYQENDVATNALAGVDFKMDKGEFTAFSTG